MPSYRIGQAAELLGVSVDTVRRWVDGGRIGAIADGGRPAAHRRTRALPSSQSSSPREREADVVVGRSARNRFPGIVTRVIKDKVTAQVEIQAGPHRVVSLMTREAADELGLDARRPRGRRREVDQRRHRDRRGLDASKSGGGDERTASSTRPPVAAGDARRVRRCFCSRYRCSGWCGGHRGRSAWDELLNTEAGARRPAALAGHVAVGDRDRASCSASRWRGCRPASTIRASGSCARSTTLPMVLPPVVGGVALLLALGRRGIVGSQLDRSASTFRSRPRARWSRRPSWPCRFSC